MTWEVYSLYLVTLAVFFTGPPDSTELLSIANGMRHGPKRNLATIAGDLSANMVQMIVAAFGLAAVLATTAWALMAIKWAGVAFLLYLGLKMLFGQVEPQGLEAAQHTRLRKLFGQGFVTAMANPWAVIFFAALFPQFLDPSAPLVPQLLILGATYVLVDGVQLFAYGWGADRVKTKLVWLQGPVLTRVSGGLMIAAAAVLAFKDFEIEKG